MAKNYNTRTASLKATIADIRNLDAKQINLDGKNILEYIGESVPTIKHANDTRETITENDLWGQWVETLEDGTVIIHDDEVINPNGNSSWNSYITKVEDNKAYEKQGILSTEKFYANIQTEKIKDGTGMFNGTAMTIFNSDLSSLENGTRMFVNGGLSAFDGLRSFNVELPSLINGYEMFRNCPLTLFTSNLSSLNDGTSMFYRCISLTSFTSDLSSLTNGTYMFYNCVSLSSFTSNLNSLRDGNCMFRGCTSLTSFTSDLSSLPSGTNMFEECTDLTSFTSDLSSLSCGAGMFNECTSLTSFTSDLSSLVYGGSMFRGCTNLTSFTSDLSSLILGGGIGSGMFYACTSLSSFTSDLSSLIYGDSMFYGCKLNHHSIMYIIESIKDIYNEKKLYQDGTIPYVTQTDGIYSTPNGFMSDGSYVYTYYDPQTTTTTISSSRVGLLTLGIDVTNDSETIEQQLQTFAEGCLCDSWAELKQEFVDKGWTVTFQYGGTNSSITLSEDEQFRGVPVYARLIEVSDEDKDMAEYCTEDGTKFYNIDWGHDVTDYDSYQYFGSLLEACGYFGIVPKEYANEA